MTARSNNARAVIAGFILASVMIMMCTFFVITRNSQMRGEPVAQRISVDDSKVSSGTTTVDVIRSIDEAAALLPLRRKDEKWQLFTDRSALPDRIKLRGVDDSQKMQDATELMHSPPDHTCDYLRPVGKGDGPRSGGQSPYRVCFDAPFRPISKHCLVYSFGIADDWSFDDTMARQIGCAVLSFDPSIGLKKHRRAPNHIFFPWGISSHDHTLEEKGWLMKSLSSIHTLLGLENRTIDILKIDAEGAEVASFQQLITDGFLQKYVKQILVEWHPSEMSVIAPTLTAYYRLHHEAGFKTFFAEPRFQFGIFYLVESLINSRFNS